MFHALIRRRFLRYSLGAFIRALLSRAYLSVWSWLLFAEHEILWYAVLLLAKVCLVSRYGHICFTPRFCIHLINDPLTSRISQLSTKSTTLAFTNPFVHPSWFLLVCIHGSRLLVLHVY